MDQIYRNRTNRAYCKEHGIRISEPVLGRPRKMTSKEREQAYGDNIDWIGVNLCAFFDLDLFKVHLEGNPASKINKVSLGFECDLLSGHYFKN